MDSSFLCSSDGCYILPCWRRRERRRKRKETPENTFSYPGNPWQQNFCPLTTSELCAGFLKRTRFRANGNWKSQRPENEFNRCQISLRRRIWSKCLGKKDFGHRKNVERTAIFSGRGKKRKLPQHDRLTPKPGEREKLDSPLNTVIIKKKNKAKAKYLPRKVFFLAAGNFCENI